MLGACSMEEIPGIAEITEIFTEEERELYPVVYDFLYYYEQLNEEQKMIYACLLESSDAYAHTAEFMHDVEKNDLCIAMEAFRRDHPEVFWTAEYTMYSYGSEGLVRSVEFSEEGDYEETSKEISSAASAVIETGLSYDNTYDRVKYFYDWIVDSCTYEENAENSQNIRSVFLTHASVCSGYAQAFMYLCNEAGIPCTLVKGTADGGSHAWNAVWINDQAYWVDVTWGDPVFEGDPGIDTENYNYFMVDDEILLRTHTPSSDVNTGDEVLSGVLKYPECSDSSLDYYAVHGALFTSYDRNEIRSFIYGYLNEGITENISFRFYDEDTYDTAYDDLFGSEKSIEDIFLDWYMSSLRYSYSPVDESGVISVSVYPQ